MASLEELGKLSYQKAVWNDFKGAIEILNRTITKYPNDWRLYNNRSYCYCMLKDYKSALTDAEYLIKEFSTLSSGFYRKADILIELKKYLEAEVVLNEFLKLEPNNEGVKLRLHEVQITQLRSGGKYTVHDAKTALKLTNFNTSQAKAFLDVGGMRGATSTDKNDIYYSDEELDEPTTSVGTMSIKSAASDDNEYDPCIDPSNPFKSNSVWVGNVTKKITEEKIKPIFSKFGKIKSIIVQHQNFCAFVNYMDYNMASVAMKKFTQHLPLEDTFLVIRFPDNSKSNVLLGKKNGIKLK